MAEEQGKLNLPAPQPIHLPSVEDLIAVVVRKHAILLKPGDPAFVLVTIFEESARASVAAMTARLEMAQHAITATAIEQKDAARIIGERIINEGSEHVARRMIEAGEEAAAALAQAVVAQLAPTLDAINSATTAALAVQAKSKIGQRASYVAAAISVLALVATAGFYFGTVSG